MSKRKLIIAIAIVILGVGWYLFRPELLFINRRVSEQFPTASAASGQSATLSAGQFHSVAHETKGNATIYQLPDGRKTLRLTNFETSNGPDVVVYLVAASDASDSETVTRAGFLPLGSH